MRNTRKKLIALYVAIMLIFCSIPMERTYAAQSRSYNFSTSYSLGNNDADNMVAIARAQLGKTKAQLGYTEAWCADFVSDCAKLAGISNKIPFNSSCYYMYHAVLNAGGKVVSTPQKGDLVFYYCTSCSAVPWVHVGIMINSTQSIEGNYGGAVSSVNGVYRDSYNHTVASGTVVRKFVRPAYNNTADFCNCSTSYAGNYTVNTESLPLNIRDSHSTSGAVIGTVPKGTTVSVSKANGTWAHVTYKGVSGYCSMSYLSKAQTDYEPQGYIDVVEGGDGTVYVKGWAFDRNSLSSSVDVHVYIGGPAGTAGAEGYAITANKQRTDVNDVFPGVGNYHGFEETITTGKTGNQPVYIYMIDVEQKSTPLLGSRTANIAKDRTIKISYWFSDSKMGDKITSCKLGEWVYLCYELYDADTGKKWNEVESKDYQVKETIYHPDGSERNTCTYDDSDYNWIGIKTTTAGIHKGIIELTGDGMATVECSLNVQEPEKYTITYDYNNEYETKAAKIKTENVSYTIINPGANRWEYFTADANGGKFSGGNMVYDVKFEGKFKNWNTKADGTGTTYTVGSTYDTNADLTLYAQYELNKVTVEEPVREGYEFLGWNSKADGSGYIVTSQTMYKDSLKIYAQWEKVATPSPTPSQTPTPMPSKTPVESAKPSTSSQPMISTQPATNKPLVSTVPASDKPLASTQPEVTEELKIITSNEYAKTGELIPITIHLQDNPGITSMTLDVEYDDSALTLKSVENAELITGATFHTSNSLNSNPYRLIWNVGTGNNAANGKIVTIYFQVKETAALGEYPITISANQGDVFNTTLENVSFTCVNGSVKVYDGFQPGDVNHDNVINAKDATLINQYYAGWQVSLDMQAADVTGDGIVNAKDATLILQKYAGWNVELKEGTAND